ncbi:hypothetical protein ACH5RR_024990 [Cinchona calisaya]|uniref:Peptidase A1 domain-containing protein n=1 Tax=Cinchona calisaya TaxID=153742 RepID=A0ABD2YZF1_9GENT
MAQTQSPLLLTLILFSLTTLTSLVFSLRPHKQQNQGVVLDVSSSIYKTLQVFSNEKAKPTTTTTTTTSSSSVLSFSLYPRDSIIKPQQYESYSSLISSRLAADVARANFINSKLQLALSKSQVKTDILPEDLEVPVTHGPGGYAARIGVGQPAKEFHLITDTGSDINWVQCQNCKECFLQSDPKFDPSKSTTYKSLTCKSQQCTSLRTRNCTKSNKCLYGVPYGDGSFTIGNLATETLSFGNSGSVDNVAIGCGRVNRGNFGGFAGILGLGGSVLALPSQIKATSFSYCLVNIDSSSSTTLEFNSPSPCDSVLVPFVTNPSFDVYYYVELTGITVGGHQISIPASVFQIGNDGNSGIILDSGTTVTQLEAQVYKSLRDTFVKYTQNLPKASGFQILDTCYDLSSSSNVTVPKISFQFSGGKTVSLPPENYLIPVTSNGKFCLAFTATSQIVSIIGNTQQQGFRVTYDLANKLIGFSPNKC